MFKQILNITDAFLKVAKGVSVKFKNWRRRRNEKKIDKAIDTLDVDSVNDIVRRIKERREKRHNES